MQILAALVQEVGAPFTLTEVELQEPAPDEVVVQIAGVGGDGGHGNVALGGDFAMHLLSDLHLTA